MNRSKEKGLELRLSVKIASIEDINDIAVLFNQYRIFYGESDDINLSRQFLAERLRNQQSVIFLAQSQSEGIVGFAQLYPVFSSIAAQSAWILNDLFVAEQSRKLGVASTLICAVLDYGKDTNAAWITLQTAVDNTPAQALYKKHGFSLEQQYLTFNHRLNRDQQ